MKAILDGTPLTTSIRSTRKSVIFKINRKELMSFVNKHPGIYMILTESKYIE